MDLISKLFITLLVYSFFSVFLFTVNHFFRTWEGILFVHIPLIFLIMALFVILPDKTLIHTVKVGNQLPLTPEFALSYVRLGLYCFFWLSGIVMMLYPLKFKVEYVLYHWLFLTIIVFSASSITIVYGSFLFIFSMIPYILPRYKIIHSDLIARRESIKIIVQNPGKVKRSNMGEAMIILLYIAALSSMIILQILQVYD